jgi:hypothetical protein
MIFPADQQHCTVYSAALHCTLLFQSSKLYCTVESCRRVLGLFQFVCPVVCVTDAARFYKLEQPPTVLRVAGQYEYLHVVVPVQ